MHYGQPASLTGARAWLHKQLTEDRLMVVAAVRADQVHGFATMTVLPASLRLGEAWSIRDNFVAPQHRRKGVGSVLLQHAISTARQAGAQRVSLQTETDNTAALTLYRAAGFRSVQGLEVLNLDLAADDDDDDEAD